MDDCIFCKIIAGDMPSQKIYETDEVLAFLDIRPVNPGHTVVIPKKHSEHFLSADAQDIHAVVDAVKAIAPAILKAVGAEAMNFSTNSGRAAGQIVFHTHFHVIPRFATDGYSEWEREDGDHPDLATMAGRIKAQM